MLSLYCSPEMQARIMPRTSGAESNDFEASFPAFLRLTQPRDYLALLACVARFSAARAELAEIRRRLGDLLPAATTLGFGPRFLQSTGQLHKGGANNGLFLQITAKDEADVQIPGEEYSFGTLKRAQAVSDLQSLEKHGRRALRLHIDGDLIEGLKNIADLVRHL